MDQLVEQDRARGLVAGPRERQRCWVRDVEDVTPFESTEHDPNNENVEQDGHEVDTSSVATASVDTSKKKSWRKGKQKWVTIWKMSCNTLGLE